MVWSEAGLEPGLGLERVRVGDMSGNEAPSALTPSSAVCGALKILPEVKLDGELGGSITIECPLPKINVRMYLCREMVKPAICSTVVSNNFIKKEYDSRVTLKPCLQKNLFLVEMTELTESDSGVYACGVGTHTERGKTQKITLNVHSGRCTAACRQVPPTQKMSPLRKIETAI